MGPGGAARLRAANDAMIEGALKIVIVNDHARIVGGAAKIAIVSACGLAQRGYDVDFLAGAGPIGPELRGMPRIKVTCLNSSAFNEEPKRWRGALRGVWDRQSAQAIQTLLAKCDRRETVVHFHAYRDVLTASVAHAALEMGFACVYTAHEYSMGCPYQAFFNYRTNEICRVRGLSRACLMTRCNKSGRANKLFHDIAQFVFAKVYRIPSRFSHVIFISKLNQRVLEPYVDPNVRRSIVSNPSDFAAGPPAPISQASPFLFVGSLEQHKDPVTAARAARMIGAPIVFVGAGSLAEDVRRENPEAPATGWVSREEVEVRLRSGRALVFPSIWYEAQPLTPIEAAACGLPLIVSNGSSAVELVEALGVGEIFPAGDAEALAEKMKPYLDIDFARAQGSATRKAYEKLDFSSDLHMRRLLEIYSSELAAKTA